jgi:hypothetical protein
MLEDIGGKGILFKDGVEALRRDMTQIFEDIYPARNRH